MALAIRRDASIKVRVTTTLMMAFALVMQPMYGFVVSQVANAATADQVVINEVKPATGLVGEKWVELYNPSDKQQDLNKWRVMRGSIILGNVLSSPNAFIEARGYLVVNITSQFLPINSNNSSVELWSNTKGSKGTLIDSIDYTSVAEGQSYARAYDADSTWVKQAIPTRGFTNNPQPVVNGMNFNTHSGTDYKGINVGFSIEAFKTVTGVKVELYRQDGNLLVKNVEDKEGEESKLLALIASGVTQLSTPFITDSGTYVEEYWNMGTRTWTTADKPAKAVVTVTGTNNVDATVTESAELAPMTEPNRWTYESVLPIIINLPPNLIDTVPLIPDTRDDRDGQGAAGNTSDNRDESDSSTATATGSSFSPLQTPASIFFAQTNGNEEETDTSDDSDDTAVLGTQSDGNDKSDVKDISDNVATIESSNEGWKFLGVPWYWFALLVAAIGSVWYRFARRRNQDA